MKPILEIRNLSKSYRISHERQAYLTLRDKLMGIFQRSEHLEEFWALKDVSFDVMPGESIGIIGRNGAGKSTLLKILSRITPPTKGTVTARGRIASLLEVGTGFHQELTGRENIFMNGSILGMKKAEIKAKFDEIVDFSGVEKFLDTPLKNYSSGMQLRLAFAVAAHLEPEILIVDEVLAVGDGEFQKKCIGKMEDVTKQGRTILFVSHGMSMIKQLCSKTALLQHGKLLRYDRTSEVVDAYLHQGVITSQSLNSYTLGTGVSIRDLVVDPHPVVSLQGLRIQFEIHSENDLTIDSLGFYLNNIMQERVGILDLRRDRYQVKAGSSLIFKVDVQHLPLIEGEYRLGLFFGSTLISKNFEDLLTFHVDNPGFTSNTIPYPVDVRGRVEFDYSFYVG